MSCRTLGARMAAPVVLTIAGSDSGGGAGIQADLRTFAALAVHGATAITAITAQHDRAVQALHALPPAVVADQIDTVFAAMDVRAVKLGMLANAGIVECVAERLAWHRPAFSVLDPVMLASSGTRLLCQAALAPMRRWLVPQVDCITPNLAEAAALLDALPARSETEMAAQGRALLQLGARAVLIKGGHAPLADAVDLLVTPQSITRFASPWVEGTSVRGSGCALSAAIAAAVARGATLRGAVTIAKTHLLGLLRMAPGVSSCRAAAGPAPGDAA